MEIPRASSLGLQDSDYSWVEDMGVLELGKHFSNAEANYKRALEFRLLLILCSCFGHRGVYNGHVRMGVEMGARGWGLILQELDTGVSQNGGVL